MLREASGEPAEALADMIDAIYSDQALDPKTLELLFIAVQTALRLHGSIRVHVPRAIEAGASAREIVGAMMASVPNAGMNGAIECWPVAAEFLGA